MAELEFPILLAGNILSRLPAPVLTRAAAVLMRRLERRHPRLFRALSAQSQMMIGIEPSDLPHRFLLRFGGGAINLTAAAHFTQAPTTTIKGRLAALLALLEGRLDSDAAFFSREITVIGNTAAIVMLRNTLERDAVDLLAAITAMFGPAAPVAQRMALTLERHIASAHRRAEQRHDAFHAARREPAPLATRCERLEREMQTLSGRLARIEAQARRRGQSGKVT
ncbi:SCP2 domain-containing protein [Acidiphilium sp.]|uniref:ubiquinone anaerobic biosynthesis accessory factor UbiT n=1 Tax=Acidiphilium sp. TaxID=527 RepID=UPI00258513EB|nr:SCP2 sterol-binding domain-containing protein [Acidiphilium sp.]